jgi:ubiquinone/menaquinone biosynthesis C-methylase UbiE
VTTTDRPRSATVPRTYVDANRLWVDSRLRAVAQRQLEARVLRRLGGRVDGGRALELGTGRRGTGLRAALEVFGASRADGVELFPPSVIACRAAVADLDGQVSVERGDVRVLEAPDRTYDAVFGYHVLHHTPDWRRVVQEAARVLAPGGRFYSAEMTARFVDSRLLRAVSAHPADGDRPTPDGIATACRAAGLQVVGQRVRLGGAWTALVARRP